MRGIFEFYKKQNLKDSGKVSTLNSGCRLLFALQPSIDIFGEGCFIQLF